MLRAFDVGNTRRSWLRDAATLVCVGLCFWAQTPPLRAQERQDSALHAAITKANEAARRGSGAYFVVGLGAGWLGGNGALAFSKSDTKGYVMTGIAVTAITATLVMASHEPKPIDRSSVSPPYGEAFDSAFAAQTKKRRRSLAIRGGLIGAVVGLAMGMSIYTD